MGRWALRTLFALIAWALVGVAGASAQSSVPSLRPDAWAGCGGTTGAGTFDQRGRVYVPCGHLVGVYAETGVLVEQFDAGREVAAVAPRADGGAVYLATPDGAPLRMVRGEAGWVRDGWAAAPYVIGGVTRAPRGRQIAVDDNGNVYLADGAGSANDAQTVIKYDARGAVVTRFGARGPGWALDVVRSELGGIAVRADGSVVYAADPGNNRVQIWIRQWNGDYLAVGSIGATSLTDPGRGLRCARPYPTDGRREPFARPTDVKLDDDGLVYVLNASCDQVVRFSPSALFAIDSYALTTGAAPAAGFAVGRNGVTYVPMAGAVLVPSTIAAHVVAGPPRPELPPVTPIEDDSPPRSTDARPASPPAATPVADPLPTTPTVPAPTPPTPRRLTLRIEKPRLTGARDGRRTVAIVARCSRACTLRATVRRGSRVLGRSASSGAAAGRRVTLRVPLERLRSGRAVISVSARGGPLRAAVAQTASLTLR